ncbi:MAG: hypothetical protein DWI59_01955 [Chloroflexi bacterium]|nr:MAG: hypothetical protein DWI59_01955 [Chloroflexota bacterium]
MNLESDDIDTSEMGARDGDCTRRVALSAMIHRDQAMTPVPSDRAARLPITEARRIMPTRRVPRPFALLWGTGKVVEEAAIVGGLHAPSLQLLQYEQGEKKGQYAIRFAAYDTEGELERRPLIINEREIAALRAELQRSPKMKALLQRLVAD